MNIAIKRLLLFLACLGAMPFFFFYRLLGFVIGQKRAFPGISQFISLFPGISGQLIRRGFYYLAIKDCSPEITIDFGTFFPSPDLSLGSHVYIGANCIISSCIIGDDVVIGSNVHFANKEMHRFDSVTIPIRLQGGLRKTINVGMDTWIGNNSIILADVGAHCVIGAGSVVTKPIADWSIAVGNPARIIRKRK
jgi:virginiamycin A acetyltransferase